MDFSGRRYFLIGIKGTGMSTLAVLLKKAGAAVSGCDKADVFPTDELLHSENIEVYAGFDASLLDPEADGVVYSDAYRDESCPVLAKARETMGSCVFSYPQFIALVSRQCRTYAVAGTHGKTTSAAAASYLLSSGKRQAFPFFALFGSSIMKRGPVYQGSEEFLVEACEYRDHFLLYKTRGALITSIEMDHPDWFADEDAVSGSFQRFVSNIDQNGFLVLCMDSPRVKALARWTAANRRDLVLVEYGFSCGSVFRLRRTGGWGKGQGYSIDLLPYRQFDLPTMSQEIAADYFGACLLASSILLDRKEPRLYFDGEELISDEILGTMVGTMLSEMEDFPGVRSRSEIVAIDTGIICMDDYAHHPTEIRVCLENLRKTYPECRLCVAFCPHTYSRTQALMDQFVSALSLADMVVVQKTYASARMLQQREDNARHLADELVKRTMRQTRGYLQNACYMENDEDAASYLAGALGQGDICLSLGAGNNRPLLGRILEIRKGAFK